MTPKKVCYIVLAICTLYNYLMKRYSSYVIATIYDKNLKTDYKYVYENKTYFFADEKNLERFRDNPDAYLQEDK